MRIIGNINHPELKITIFKMDNRVSVKFENPGYELSFKMGTDERFDDPEKVRKWVDEKLLSDVMAVFAALHQTRLTANVRAFPEAHPETFEEII
ncbi:MAG: hypothetical protein EP344_06770 [Bacteroidetes bacterium]|nr:MAG: hypothetical protein EP344_06770 [Bacteroidota bacterium]